MGFIEWFDATKTLPTVTIANYGITLNTTAAEILKGTERIKLGLDSSCKKIYLKKVPSYEEGSFAFTDINEKNRNIRISCKEFIQFLSVKCNLNTSESEKYYVIWDEENNSLVVDLSKKIQKPRRKVSDKQK